MPSDLPPRSAQRARALSETVFWGPLLLVGIVVAAFPPHTVDGPAHLLGGDILARWNSVGIFRQYYALDWFPTPNLATSVLLAGLIRAFGPQPAERALLVACVVALPLGLRYAITALRPAVGWAGIAALPFAFDYLYGYGFHNFCLATALFLVCAGAALRAAPEWTPGRTAWLAIALTATWFTHLVGFAMALIVTAVLVLPGRPRRRLPALAAAAPGLILTAAYLAHTSGAGRPHWAEPVTALLGLISLHTQLVTWTRLDNVPAVALALSLLGMAAATRRTGRSTDPRVRAIAGAAVAAGVAFLAAPEDLGIAFGFIGERLSVFPVLLGLLWLLTRAIPARWTAGAVAASLSATAALGALRLPELRREDAVAQEYVSAAQFLRPGSTLIALRFAEFTPAAGRNPHADPLRHLSGELAVRTGSVDVGHYEAVFDYFPARFRPDRDLRRAVDPTLTGLEQVPSRVDLDGVRRLTGHPIDFVVLVGVDRAAGAAALDLANTRAGLARDHVLVGRTRPRGVVEVWAATG